MWDYLVDLLFLLLFLAPVLGVLFLMWRTFRRLITRTDIIPGILRFLSFANWALAVLVALIPLYALYFYLTDEQLWQQEGPVFSFVVLPLIVFAWYASGIILFNLLLNLALYRMHINECIIEDPRERDAVLAWTRRTYYLHALLFRFRGLFVSDVLLRVCPPESESGSGTTQQGNGVESQRSEKRDQRR